MSDGINIGIGPPPSLDLDAARRASERIFGTQGEFQPPPASGAAGGMNPIDLLRTQTTTANRAPWNGGELPPLNPPPAGSDRPASRLEAPVSPEGVMQLSYGDPNFDAKLAQSNYNKVVITGVPKEFSPSPWVDESGKGYFFWFKNPKNPDASDRTKHYFPANMKQVEIAQYQGSSYKPVLINADEMRIAASQAYMRSQNDSGYGSFKGNTDVFKYANELAKVTGPALQYEEQLMREGAKNSPSNPYFRIYLADVLTAEAIQPVIQALASGQRAYFDNPQTQGKIDEALKQVRQAGQITHTYGNLNGPPRYEMPLSPFGLNPYSYNPDSYWSGAAYQAATREVQLTALKKMVTIGNLPMELPPALPQRQ